MPVGKKHSNPCWVDLPDYLLQELRQHITFLKEQSLKKGLAGDIDLFFIDLKRMATVHIAGRKSARR